MDAPIWYQGQIYAASEIPEASAILEGPGTLTTAQVRDGAVTLERYHVERLQRDTQRLGRRPPDGLALLGMFRALAEAAFPESKGIIRALASTRDAADVQLIGSTRPWPNDPVTWTAETAPFPHRGPGKASGAKLAHEPVWQRARKLANQNNQDEILLFDAQGLLVEGSRSNLIVATEAGHLLYPQEELGAVNGVALTVLKEAVSDLQPANMTRETVQQAREVIAVNAVRGPRSITHIDRSPIGTGQPGPVAKILHAAFEGRIQDEARSRT